MDFKTRVKNSHTIIELQGSLDIYTASKMKKQITALIEEEELDSLVLDMSKVTHMDSSGIALLANLQKKMKSNNSNFALLSCTSDIMAVLKLSSLDSFFTIYNSEGELK